MITHSEQETIEAGAALAQQLAPGAVVLLSGQLGAGKTVFVRGLAKGLGLAEEAVNSPTFTLIQEYRGGVTLYHVDLYRLSGGEPEDLGIEELISPRSIVAIEWPERFSRPFSGAGAVTVQIEDRGDDEREILIAPSVLSPKS